MSAEVYFSFIFVNLFVISRNEQPPFMGIDRYKSGGGVYCVDKWKRSHVGIAIVIEYASVMHRRT